MSVDLSTLRKYAFLCGGSADSAGMLSRYAGEAAAELEQLRAALAALVDALPRCYECDRPLVKALDIDCYGHCDKHGEYPGEASWAEPLRAALRLLGREP